MQAALREVGGVVWHAEDGNLALAQKLLARAVQVVKVPALAMGDERVGHALQRRVGLGGQVHQGVALAPGAQVAQRGQAAPGREHGVHQQADGAARVLELEQNGGVASLGDEHGGLSVGRGVAIVEKQASSANGAD